MGGTSCICFCYSYFICIGEEGNDFLVGEPAYLFVFSGGGEEGNQKETCLQGFLFCLGGGSPFCLIIIIYVTYISLNRVARIEHI